MMVLSCFGYALKKLNDLLNSNRDDPLYAVRAITTDLIKWKSLNLFLSLSLGYNMILLVIQVIYFSINFDLKQFIQYFSLNVGALQGYYTMFVTITYQTEVKGVTDFLDSHFIPLSSVKEATYQRIIQNVTIRRYLFLLNVLAGHLLFIFLMPLFGYEDEYYFPVFFFKEYVKPNLGTFVANSLRLCFYLSYYPVVLTSIIPVHLILYYLTHMEMHLIALEDLIGDIDHSSMSDEVVKEQLILCTKQYLNVATCMNDVRGWILKPMFFVVCGSFVLLLSFCYFAIAQASIAALPRILSLGLLASCHSLIYAITGQGLVDQCENIHRSLYLLRWYEYSRKNSRLLQMFMITTKKTLYLNLVGYFALDATLLLKIYKFLFSSLATIQQVVALRHNDNNQ